MCWYCHWGLPKPIADIYERALIEIGGNESALESGPAHMVWGDFNFDDESIDYCLNRTIGDGNFSHDEIYAIRRSLLALLAVPSEYREMGLDFEADPIDNPPPEYWEMVK